MYGRGENRRWGWGEVRRQSSGGRESKESKERRTLGRGKVRGRNRKRRKE